VMVTCKQITEMATDRTEGSLGFLDRLRFDRHLARCGGCRAYVGQLEATIRALRRLPEPEISPRLNDALMAQFDAWTPLRTASLANRGTPEVRPAARFTLWPTLGAAAMLGLLVAFARNRSQAPEDWLVGAALAAAALAMAWLAGRFAVGIIITAVSAAAAASLVAGRGGALDLATGVDCLSLELVAAVAVGGAAWLGARRGSRVVAGRSLSAGAAAGALVADAALQITCGAHDALPHLLAFHLGGVLLVAAAAVFVLRRSPESARA
jgi:Putative zinc-finger